MYYDNNIYISKDNSVLFDLNSLDIYQIDKNTLHIFENIYNGNSKSLVKDDNYMEIYNTFFNNRNVDHKCDNKITAVRINVSNMCNFKCNYCFANCGNYSKKDKLMNFEIAKQICDFIKNNLEDVTDVGFFGGEPTLNYKVIKKICQDMPTSINFNMITNLSILNEDIINLIKKYNISVTASIDGDKEINDLNRITKNNKPTYDLVSKNIETLLNNNCQLKMIESTYTSSAYKKYSKSEIAKLLSKEFNTKHVLVADVDTSKDELKLPFNSVYSKKNISNSLKEVFENIFNNKVFLTCVEAKPLIYFVTKDNSDYFCTPGISTLIFDENGDIWPCQAFINKENFKMGNIFEKPDNNINFKIVQDKLLNLKNQKKQNVKSAYQSIGAKLVCQRFYQMTLMILR